MAGPEPVKPLDVDAAFYARQAEWGSNLIAGGLPAISVCAAVGNCSEENRAEAVTKGVKDHGSDGGFQWRLDRLDGPEGLKPWCTAQNMPWYTIASQAKFFLWECRKKYPDLWIDLTQGVKKLETLTANIMAEYEVPNAQYAALDVRIGYALGFRNRWIKGAVVITEPPPIPMPSIPTQGGFYVDPALIATIIQIGAPILESIVKAILSAHGIIPGQSVTIHPPVAPGVAAPAFNPDELVQKIMAALSAAAKSGQ